MSMQDSMRLYAFGVAFDIIFTDDDLVGPSGDDVWGIMQFSKDRIVISNAGNPSRRRETLHHEITHLVFNYTAIKTNNGNVSTGPESTLQLQSEEPIVGTWSSCFYSILTDPRNEEVLNYLYYYDEEESDNG